MVYKSKRHIHILCTITTFWNNDKLSHTLFLGLSYIFVKQLKEITRNICISSQSIYHNKKTRGQLAQEISTIHGWFTAYFHQKKNKVNKEFIKNYLHYNYSYDHHEFLPSTLSRETSLGKPQIPIPNRIVSHNPL